MNLFSLAAQHRTWLAARQTVAAENIANANTPGFRAKAVAGFSGALEAEATGVTRTHTQHIALRPSARAHATEASDDAQSTHAGNTVDIEEQMLASGEVRRDYALNASITRTFSRMLMAGLRG